METVESYLNRKRREISLLSGCLVSPLQPPSRASVAGVIEHKFRLAAAIKAERSLQNWSITETARLPAQSVKTGLFEFSYGYQRADLRVQGPAIYEALCSSAWRAVPETIYTNSGMSAMAAVLTALSRLLGSAEVLLPRGCYSETRELIDTFGARFRVVGGETAHMRRRSVHGLARIALLDSSVRENFLLACKPADAVDLVIFDTTCFWRTSARIEKVVKWAARSNLPLVLVRSHSKLDCLGVEYARLGSAVVTGFPSMPAKWISEIARLTNETVRLLGAAPSPSSFPPFAHTRQFHHYSVMRIAATIRNNRRMFRRIASALADSQVSAYQHGLYLTLTPSEELSIPDAKDLAATLAAELASAGLPVAHAGSFGFDFVAIEWFADPSSRRNVIRVAASDIPTRLADEIARRIVRFWGRSESQESSFAFNRSAARALSA